MLPRKLLNDSKHIITSSKETRRNVPSKAPKKTAVTGGVKKPYCYCPRTFALCEIRRFQKSTDLLIRKLPFQRLIGEVIQDCRINLCFQSIAIMPLQEAAGACCIGLFKDTSMCTIHAKCITIMSKDVQLAHCIHGQRT